MFWRCFCGIRKASPPQKKASYVCCDSPAPRGAAAMFLSEPIPFASKCVSIQKAVFFWRFAGGIRNTSTKQKKLRLRYVLSCATEWVATVLGHSENMLRLPCPQGSRSRAPSGAILECFFAHSNKTSVALSKKIWKRPGTGSKKHKAATPLPPGESQHVFWVTQYCCDSAPPPLPSSKNKVISYEKTLWFEDVSVVSERPAKKIK